MTRWISAHKFTLIAVGICGLAIAWLAWSPYTPPKTVWFWQHPWWWYLIWVAGIAVAAWPRKRRRRGQMNDMFPGGKPCPPGCHIKITHRHD